MEGYRYYYYSNLIEWGDLKFDSEHDEKETSKFLGRLKFGGTHDWHEKIAWKEMEYDQEKRWEKQMRSKDRDRNLMDLVQDKPEDIREWIYAKESEEEYIFFNKQKGTWGCSCCGAEIPDKDLKRISDSGRARHNDAVICPECKKRIVAKKRTKRIQEKTGIYLIEPINEKASVIRYTDCEIAWEYRRHTVMLDEVIRVIAYKIDTNPRRKHMVKLFYENWGNFETGNIRNRRAKVGYLYPGMYKETLNNTVYEEGSRVLEQLAAGGKKLNYNKLLIGIGKFKNFENVIEYLFKGRFKRLLNETVENIDWWSHGSYYGSLKLNGSTMEEVFGIKDRQKINRIREEDGGESMLVWMRYSEETGKRVPRETLQYMNEHKITPLDCTELTAMTPQQIQNYLEKQRAAGYNGMTPKEILEQWKDYLSMCRAAGKDVADEMVYKPRDLKLRHDQAITDANQLRIVKAMQENKEFRKKEAAKMREKYPQAEKNLNEIRERYEYGDEEYQVIVPHDLVEIIEEGQALHHCAGATERYFDRIESKETYICFLRRMEAPGIPFYTIEVEPSGTIRQHRSYMDEEPGIEEIRGFLRKWQQVLKKRLTEEDKRLAKISKEKREQNIKELEEKNNTRVLKGLAEDFMENPLEFEETA